MQNDRVATSFPVLLVATQSKLVVWDGKQHNVQTGHGLYYGITWNQGYIFVASRYDEGQGQTGKLQQLDKHLERIRFIEDIPLGSDPHQLFWFNDVLHIANTDRRCVTLWDGKFIIKEVLWTEDDRHINSIWSDGICFYVVEHCHGERAKAIVVFDLDWNLSNWFRIDVPGQTKDTGYGLHNVYTEGRALMTLAPHNLILIDRFRERPTRFLWLDDVRPGQGYLRGLARTRDYFFIGVSHLSERSHRGFGHSDILILDSNFKTVGRIRLEEVGQILEIRVISEADFAHNLIKCPLEWR